MNPRSRLSNRSLALLAIVLAVLTWGSSNVVAKLISTSGIVVSFYRLWFAIPLLWILPMVVPDLRQKLGRDWLMASLIGGGLFSLHQILFFNSLKLTSVANVAIIGALQPVLVLIVAGPMFGEQVTMKALLWAAVAVVGTALVVLGSKQTPSWSAHGDSLAVANLFAFTAYFLASKRARLSVGALEYVIGMTTVSGLLIFVAALWTDQDLLSPTGVDWIWLLFLALVPGTIGHFLANWAHPHVPAFVVSMMLLAVPVLAALGAAWLLHEPLNALHLVGGTLVLGAVWRIVRSLRAPVVPDLAQSRE